MTKIFVCGDVINRFSDTQFIDEPLVHIVQSADYSICNYEGVHPFIGSKQISMLQKDNTLSLLKEAGFDMVLLANNHITDHGKEGLKSTLDQIDSLDLDRIGADFGYEQVYKPIVKIINGKRFGFINLCEAQVGQYKSLNQSFGYAWIGDKNVDERIAELRGQVDYLLIFPHAGLEHYSLPLIEYRQLYRHYIELGADAVLASHPHVPQGIESYNGKVISYSLGNFYFPKPEIPKNDPRNSSYSLILSFEEGKIQLEPIFTCLKGNVVRIDENSTVNLHELSSNLEDGAYDVLIKEQYAAAFANLVYPLYKEALVGTAPNDNFILKIKYVIKYLFASKKYFSRSRPHRLKQLKRLTENETYRYITLKAIDNYLETL